MRGSCYNKEVRKYCDMDVRHYRDKILDSKSLISKTIQPLLQFITSILSHLHYNVMLRDDTNIQEIQTKNNIIQILN